MVAEAWQRQTFFSRAPCFLRRPWEREIRARFRKGRSFDTFGKSAIRSKSFAPNFFGGIPACLSFLSDLHIYKVRVTYLTNHPYLAGPCFEVKNVERNSSPNMVGEEWGQSLCVVQSCEPFQHVDIFHVCDSARVEVWYENTFTITVLQADDLCFLLAILLSSIFEEQLS